MLYYIKQICRIKFKFKKEIKTENHADKYRNR